MPIDEFRADNRANWDDRVAGHIEGYGLDRYFGDPALLSEVVEFDRERLGDLHGLRVLHLQCHIGTDTISLARLGAAVTGVDFSPRAIAAARDLFERTGTPGRFIVSELYDAPGILDEQFDLVYTGVGALNWLPDIDGWAAVVDHFTRPGGRLFLTEGHPVAWALDLDRDDELLVLGLPYFEGRRHTWDVDESYVGTARLTATIAHEWNHGLGEIITSLLIRRFQIRAFVEHDEQPWRMCGWMEEARPGWFRLPEGARDRVPLMYTLIAEKAPPT